MGNGRQISVADRWRAAGSRLTDTQNSAHDRGSAPCRLLGRRPGRGRARTSRRSACWTTHPGCPSLISGRPAGSSRRIRRCPSYSCSSRPSWSCSCSIRSRRFPALLGLRSSRRRRDSLERVQVRSGLGRRSRPLRTGCQGMIGRERSGSEATRARRIRCVASPRCSRRPEPGGDTGRWGLSPRARPRRRRRRCCHAGSRQASRARSCLQRRCSPCWSSRS